VVDLLSILGVMLNIPKTLLGLTLLAWGNCLGDMNANVAMTKKGFGEMAITGCMAGPVFNVLMGLGLSTVFSLINDVNASIPFSFFA
jgi:sodium/potassium/calcium exchanger 6